MSVDGAILIVEYFRMTALRAHRALSMDEFQSQIPKDHNKLYEALPDEFTTAEGVLIADTFNMSRHSFNRFLKKYEGKLFENFKRGVYKKK